MAANALLVGETCLPSTESPNPLRGQPAIDCLVQQISKLDSVITAEAIAVVGVPGVTQLGDVRGDVLNKTRQRMPPQMLRRK